MQYNVNYSQMCWSGTWTHLTLTEDVDSVLDLSTNETNKSWSFAILLTLPINDVIKVKAAPSVSQQEG